MPTASPQMTLEEFLRQLDARLSAGQSLSQVGRPLAASRQSVMAWKARRTRPNRATLLLARYVWTYGKLPD